MMGVCTNLLNIDAMTGTAEDQAGLHGSGKSLGLEGVSVWQGNT